MVFLEADTDAEVFEHSCRFKAFNRISREARHRFGDDAVDLSALTVSDQPQEFRPLALLRAGNTLIGINPCGYGVFHLAD